MNDQSVVLREGDERFAVPIHRAVLRDVRLSWGARGMFCALWDFPRKWKPRIEHLAGLGPDGRDAVRARMKELETVGALRIEPIQQAGGRFGGTRWVLVSPARWAVEAPLGTAKFTEFRETRDSVNSNLGRPNTKVNQSEGSPSQQGLLRAEGEPAASLYFSAFLDLLLRNGAATKNPNLDKDRAEIEALREIAAWLGEGGVMAAIKSAIYPAQAVKACRDSGLLSKMEAARCKQAASDADAVNMARSNEALAREMAMDVDAITKGDVLREKWRKRRKD